MFSSLRSRLWLSYALLLVAALVLTALILLIYLIRSPIAYRQTYARLEAVREVLLTTRPDLPNLQGDKLVAALNSTADVFNVRILVLSSDLSVVADTRDNKNAGFNAIRPIALQRSNITLRDGNGKIWLVYVSYLENGNILLICTPRTRLALLLVLRNDILPPFLVAGLVGILLSLVVALGLARWISDPLQDLMTAARRVPDSFPQSVPLHGPHEVQELTHSFNTMTARVTASQASQRELIANVSHELKTPLTVIRGYAQSLQDGTANTEPVRQQAVEIIQEETERMHRMVLDLLDLARLDAGTLELKYGQVDLQLLLQNVVQKFTPQAEAAGIKLDLEVGNMPFIPGDGDRLAQVFTNLMDNAVKYSRSGGRIQLRASIVPPASDILVEVSDTGVGIPPEAITHIFERFYQADPARAGGASHGSGLGLAIVREIITAHGGTIAVRSEMGQGSTFGVTLPSTTPGHRPGVSPENN